MAVACAASDCRLDAAHLFLCAAAIFFRAAALISFLAGLAGLVVSARIGSGQPGLGVGYELDAIAAAVIGGTSLSAGGIGTVAGTIVGALIIGVLNNTLDLMNVSAFWQQIVKGCIIVGAVILDQLKNRGGK